MSNLLKIFVVFEFLSEYFKTTNYFWSEHFNRKIANFDFCPKLLRSEFYPTHCIRNNLLKVKTSCGKISLLFWEWAVVSTHKNNLNTRKKAAQIADQSQYTCFMENISYPRYLGKSMKIEPDHRLSSCRIEIRPTKNGRGVAAPPPAVQASPIGGGLADRRGQMGRPSRPGPSGQKRPQSPNRRRPADLLNRGRPQTPIRGENNKRFVPQIVWCLV